MRLHLPTTPPSAPATSGSSAPEEFTPTSLLKLCANLSLHPNLFIHRRNYGSVNARSQLDAALCSSIFVESERKFLEPATGKPANR
jgi:hypothetical protein